MKFGRSGQSKTDWFASFAQFQHFLALMALLNRIALLTVFLSGSASLRADINSSVLPPPQAEAAATRVLRGSVVTVELRGHYGGSSFVRFWIVRPPAHGNLSQLRTVGDNRATIVYSNNGDPATTDSFTFIIQAGGRVSSPTEVRVTVDERPARLRLPERIDFDEIMAGTTEARMLTVTNDGGGVLEGHLTVSSPWILALPDYRVAAGATETIALAFRPNEVKTFVGKITLTGSDGSETTVLLAGAASSPIKIAPNPLRLTAPESPTAPRRAIVFFTNRTNDAMNLEFRVSGNFKPIAPIQLPAKEDRDVTIEVRPEITGSIHEAITIVGPGFTLPLEVDADARAPAPTPTATETPRQAIAPPPTVTPPVATPTATPRATVESTPPPSPSPTGAPVAIVPAGTQPFVGVSARRVGSSRWELQWPSPKTAGVTYRIEERLLALDANSELQVSWRPLTASKILTSDNRARTELAGLKPHEIHILRLTALNSDGSVFGESNLVVLSPVPQVSHGRIGLLILFGGLLAVVLFLRWRANREFA